MEFNEYQKKAKETAKYPNIGDNFVYPTLGFVGEAGELANKISKIFRDDDSKITEIKREEIKHELGDALWYLSQLALEFNIELDDVAVYNLEKLASRKKRGEISGSGDNR